MNDSNQYMVQVGGDFDQNAYIIQDANGVPVQYEAGTLIQGDLSDGTNLLGESRWMQGSNRGAKILNNQNFINGDVVNVNGGGLNLNTRFTPSSIVMNSSAAGTQYDQDNLRMTPAVTGGGGRGRPRGRKPSRGNFPVVPIDMVRQLGIEQQVILQPTVPVAMKNKTTMCKPLFMSKKTQCDENDISTVAVNIGSNEPTIKYIHVPVFVPVPVPMYIPVPTFIRAKSDKNDSIDQSNLNTASDTINEEIPEQCHKAHDIIDSITQDTENETDDKEEEPLNIYPKDESEDEIEEINATNYSNNNVEIFEHSKLKRPLINEDDESSAHKLRKIDGSQENTTNTIGTTGVSGRCKLKYSYGINAWRHWSKNINLLKCSVEEIDAHLADFVVNIRKPNNEVYVPDSIFYLCLGIQLFLQEHEYDLDVFSDVRMARFQMELNGILGAVVPRVGGSRVLVCRVEEDHLWESRQLGSSSPAVLVFSVCYLITKAAKLQSAEQHMNLRLRHLDLTEGHALLRLDDGREVRLCESSSSDRCFYALLSAYIDQCKAVVQDCTDSSLYLTPIEEPGAPMWYQETSLAASQIDTMLNRIRIVKEVEEALLSP